MSQHPSLLGNQKGKRHRSVLKRFEKLKYLIEKDRWDKDSSIYNLPKVKSIKFKVKKEKAATPEAQAEAGAGQPAQGGVAQPQAQPTAAAKQPASEKQASGPATRQAPAKEKKGKA